MASKAATLGDPRRPAEVKRPTAAPFMPVDDTLSHALLTASFAAGIFSILFQSKPAVWVGVLLMGAGYSHVPYDGQDAMRMMMLTSTMVMWAFVQAYLKQFLVPGASPQPPQQFDPSPSDAAASTLMMED